jgi:hypothetical protein
MTTLLARLLPWLCIVGLSIPAALASSPLPRRGTSDAVRHDRRGLDNGGTSRAATVDRDALKRAERLHHVELVDGSGCDLDNHPRLVKALLALRHQSQLMSLEVWGDSHAYRPYQSVTYYMRVPRISYVTLFWLGPKGDAFAPIINLRVPANRNISVDPHSIVVPPLGREQWVAIGTLEPIGFRCAASDQAMVRMLEQTLRLPHAVGRWEVWSDDDPPAADPRNQAPD